MKKLEEIKKGLECCVIGPAAHQPKCGDCPYMYETMCSDTFLKDALALAQQLERKLNQAVEDIRLLGRTGEFICPVCAHYNHGEGTKGECVKCLTGDGFRWSGEKNGGASE